MTADVPADVLAGVLAGGAAGAASTGGIGTGVARLWPPAAFLTDSQQRVTQLESKLEQGLAQLKAELNTDWERRFTHVEVRFERELGTLRSDLLRWMFTFWTGTLLALAGLLFAILKVH